MNKSGFGGWEVRNLDVGVWYLRSLTMPSRPHMQDEEVCYFNTKQEAQNAKALLESGVTELDMSRSDIFRRNTTGKRKPGKQPKFE